MANQMTLELNIYSAKDLDNVNLITKMDVYAVVSINGDESLKNQKEKTFVDRTGDSEPTWNHTVKFSVDQRLAREGRLTLVVKLVCERIFGDKDLGEVQVPILELLNSSPSFNGDGHGQGMRFVTYQVRNPCGRGKGSLTFSYRFDIPSVKPDSPVYQNPIASLSPVTYPPQSEPGFYPPVSSIGYYPPSQPQGYLAPPYPNPHRYDSPYPEHPVTAYPPSPSGSNINPPPSPSASNLYPPPQHQPYPPQHQPYPPQHQPYPPQHQPYPPHSGHSYHQVRPSQSFHGYAPGSPQNQHVNGYPPQHQPYPPHSGHSGHSYHQVRPSQSFHGYAPGSPQHQHVYGYPPSPGGYGHGCPGTQAPPKKNNKSGVGLAMGAGLLGGALGGLMLGDIVSDAFDF